MPTDLLTNLATGNLETLFLCGAVIAGGVILVEAYILNVRGGEFQNSPALSALSFLEFIWLAICALALFALDTLNPIERIVAAIFILHNVFGWVYNMRQFKKAGVIEKIKQGDEDNIVLPKKSIDYSFSFALVYIALSGVVLVNHIYPFLPDLS